MSRNVSAELKAHLARRVTTVCLLWRIEREDEVEFFFTSHVDDITYAGDIYLANAGAAMTALQSDRTMGVDNLEALTLLLDGTIERDDIDAGRFDGALVDIQLVNYEDLTMGSLVLAQDWTVGNIELQDFAAVFEIRAIAQRLQAEIGELYTRGCRYRLGDDRCTFNLDNPDFYRDASVDYAYADQQTFVADLTPPSDDLDFFRYGKITWTSGLNNGLSMEIDEYDSVTMEVTLFLPMVFAIAPGDTFRATAGCDKQHIICHERFDNVENFGGFPSIPDGERIELAPVHRKEKKAWSR